MKAAFEAGRTKFYDEDGVRDYIPFKKWIEEYDRERHHGSVVLMDMIQDKETGAKAFKFEIKADNGATTVTQTLDLETIPQSGKWTASIKIDGFPQKNSPNKAVMKLAEWLSWHDVEKICLK
jgi:hypothetical protein